MNQLHVSQQHSIATLAAQGWSARKIARELGIHRQTVGRYLEAVEADSKPANPPTGSQESSDSKPAIVPAGSKAGRTSQCAALSAVIEQGLLAGLSAQRIYQDLVSAHAFRGGYDAVKRFVRRLAQRMEPPFRRMECAPGQELQVDFGQGAWVIEEGKRRRPHLFRAVLSHSRKAYSEVCGARPVRALSGVWKMPSGILAVSPPRW
jgi:transposase